MLTQNNYYSKLTSSKLVYGGKNACMPILL